MSCLGQKFDNDYMYMLSTPMQSEELDVGIRFLETLWFSMASRVVEHAIRVYSVSDEKANEIREKFLRRGDYSVQPI